MDDGINRLLVFTLGGICVLLILSICMVSLFGHEPPLALTASLSAALGALLALARPLQPPTGGNH